MNKILDKIKDRDFLGKSYEINIAGRGQMQTTLGGLIGISIIIAVSITGYLSISDLFDSSSPQVSEAVSAGSIPPKIDLYQNDFFLGFGLLTENGALNPNNNEYKRFITFTGYIYEGRFDEGDINNKVINNKIDFEFGPCSTLNDTKILEFIASSPIKDILLTFGLCPILKHEDIPNYSVEGSLNSKVESGMVIEVSPCSLVNKSDCASLKEVIEFSISFAIPTVYFDPTNTESPIKRTIEQRKILALDEQYNVEIEFLLHFGEVQDNMFLELLNDKTVIQYVDIYSANEVQRRRIADELIYCSPSSLGNPECKPYISVIYKSSAFFTTRFRKYPQFLEALGLIGGVLEIFTLVFGALYLFYNERKYDQQMNKMTYRESSTAIIKDFIKEVSNQNLSNKKLDSFQESISGTEALLDSIKLSMLFEQIFLSPATKKLLPIALALNYGIQKKSSITLEEAYNSLKTQDPESRSRSRLAIIFSELYLNKVQMISQMNALFIESAQMKYTLALACLDRLIS